MIRSGSEPGISEPGDLESCKQNYSIKAEFVGLIEQTKAHLRFRESITPCDLGLSKESLEIIRSWNFSAKEAEPRLQAGQAKQPKQVKHAEGVVQLRGEGDPRAALFIVAEQSKRGVSPYAGPGGELLLKILEAIDLNRGTVYITTIPCAGPVTGAIQRIRREVEQVKPKVVCTLGPRAVQALLGVKDPLEHLRGRFHGFDAVPLMPTYHPSKLIHDAALKRPVWEDMKMIKARLGA
ncbi:MAG: uracil-DNA glycosylase [Desulfobacterium sp.]|jgi:DNA polymerase|nr:uracil-DNA glycosylase [Desulfobacterium sp.]